MRMLITGASGQLGAYLLRELASRRHRVVAWGGRHHDQRFGFPLEPAELLDRDATVRAFHQARPDAILHAAAVSTVANCHADPLGAERVNVSGTQLLTELACAAGTRLLFLSTDLVFAGDQGNYREDAATGPLSVYGRTKLAAEGVVLAEPRHSVVRLSLLFGPTLAGRPTFFDKQLAALRQKQPVALFTDEWRTPLSLATAARALVALAESEQGGLLHLGGPERLSRLEMGQRLARLLDLDPAPIVACRRDEAPAPEPRPCDTSLDSSRWRRLFPDVAWPGYEESLRELLPS